MGVARKSETPDPALGRETGAPAQAASAQTSFFGLMYIFLLCLSALLTVFKLAGLHVASWWLVLSPIFLLLAIRVAISAVTAWISWIIR